MRPRGVSLSFTSPPTLVVTSVLTLVAFMFVDVTPVSDASNQRREPFAFGEPMVYEEVDRVNAVAVGDLNGNGANDVVVVGHDRYSDWSFNVLHTYFQQPDGTLRHAARYETRSSDTHYTVESVVLGNFGGAGPVDIAIGSRKQGPHNRVEVFHNDGQGGFTSAMTLRSEHPNIWLGVTDLGETGFDDIIGIGWSEDNVDIHRQVEPGVFTAPDKLEVPYSGFNDLEVADIGENGRDDIIVISGQIDQESFQLVRQNEDGSWSDPQTYHHPDVRSTDAVAAGDVTGDGHTDVVVGSSYDGGIHWMGVFAGTGTGELNPTQVRRISHHPWAIEIADIDGDERDDVIIGGGVVGVHLQGDDGGLEGERVVDSPYRTITPHGMEVTDVTGDGRNDIVLASYTEGLAVLPQVTPPEPPPPPPEYTDIDGTTHEDAIVEITEARISHGYPDLTFRPHRSVTRGQMATFIARMLDLPGSTSAPFTDTAGSVHEPAIGALAAEDILDGYDDGTFRPNDIVTRAQMASFLSRALELETAMRGEEADFTDVEGAAHLQAIYDIAKAGITDGYPDGTYRPAQPVTRGQMATFLTNALAAEDAN